MKTIYLAGGCFWGTQKFIDQFEGVLSTEVGYANGNSANPAYEEVCRGSGHAETVKVVYDETILSTVKLLQYYFMTIDPTSVNRQGGDTGIQYRTGIYYEDETLLSDIKKAVRDEQEKYDRPLAVEVKHLENFYTAEEYHQKYLDKNPGGYCHIPAKLMEMA
ncbi:MAG: peptide-methionine (S)-S-oxide reductase MsrA [Lachnospiraceae bacterium]|nr:peptide-methionine (S)-S-oxide reductase MsrA [Lachnospiraceae bacterium]